MGREKKLQEVDGMLGRVDDTFAKLDVDGLIVAMISVSRRILANKTIAAGQHAELPWIFFF